MWDLIERRIGDPLLNAAPTVLTMIARGRRRAGPPRTSTWHRRRAALAHAARAARPTGHGRHPPVRPDRDLRPGHAVRAGSPTGTAPTQPSRRGCKARQGVGNIIAGQLRGGRPAGRDVPADGTTLGEIALRGNDVMLGYYRDAGVDRAGRTGRLVPLRRPGRDAPRRLHRDPRPGQGHHHLGRREHRRRSRSSRPWSHTRRCWRRPWSAAPDERWGEVPVAYVTLREGRRGRGRTS